jgi:cyclopropane fatty-acyl-phospholipid synthase-like methyltransferase
MANFDRKSHWEKIYQTKQLQEVSWYEPTPETSLRFVAQFKLAKSAKIMDVGGGDSLLVDHLLDLGYTDITVLDISVQALERAKERLGSRAAQVKWIVADAASFQPTERYDFWHDRAAFHFLTDEQEIGRYLETVKKHLADKGYFVVGTFSERGPEKCSGIEVRRYSEQSMSERLSAFFEKIRCITIDHLTPFNTWQNFIFCSFRQRLAA